jgi:hypothetical protein
MAAPRLAMLGGGPLRRTGDFGMRLVQALRSASIAVIALAAAIGLANAQTEPSAPEQDAPADAVTSDDVIVTAPSLREMVREFVGEVSAAGQQDQLGRWDRTVCPGVAGMRQRYAQALIDRMAAIAFTVGLEIGEPGCTPNALIYVTEDSDALAQELVTQHGALVSRRNNTGNTRGRDALAEFASTPRAVRWWHVTRTLSGDGFAVGQGESVQVRSMGRLRRGTREDFDRVLIIIDARRINGYRFGAVADYVAMATLAQLDPDSDTSGFETILNLFDAGSAPPRTVTEWDMAYLNGLYSATRDPIDEGRQEADIARLMRREVDAPPAAAGDPAPQ